MLKTVVTASPGFVSIAVQDAERSAGFYERYLGATRDTFDYGPDSAVFVGWPDVRPELRAASRPSSAVARHDEHPALVAGQRCPGTVRAGGGRWRPGPRRAVRRPIRADLRDGGSRWLSDHRVRERSATLLAATARLTSASTSGPDRLVLPFDDRTGHGADRVERGGEVPVGTGRGRRGEGLRNEQIVVVGGTASSGRRSSPTSKGTATKSFPPHAASASTRSTRPVPGRGALDGASLVVVDVSNSPTLAYPTARDFFETSTANPLAAGNGRRCQAPRSCCPSSAPRGMSPRVRESPVHERPATSVPSSSRKS